VRAKVKRHQFYRLLGGEGSILCRLAACQTLERSRDVATELRDEDAGKYGCFLDASTGYMASSVKEPDRPSDFCDSRRSLSRTLSGLGSEPQIDPSVRELPFESDELAMVQQCCASVVVDPASCPRRAKRIEFFRVD